MTNLRLLSERLNTLGYHQEAEEILKISQLSPIQLWQDLIQAANAPVPDQVLTAGRYVSSGVNEMVKNAQQFSHLSPEELTAGIKLALNPKTAGINQLEKSAQMELAKSLWNGTKSLGKGVLRVIPVVGFIFSFLIALKNFVYGLTTFAKLAKDSEQIGLNWLEILFPEKLSGKVKEYKGDPIKLSTLVQLTKYSKEFSDEGISFASNGIDFIKDVIFLFIDVGSFGWLTIGDISLSFILMGLEYLAESQTLPLFDKVIFQVINLAEAQITALSKPDFENEEVLNQWFLND